MQQILVAEADLALADFIRISSLSGLRIEEIANLKGMNITKDNCFDVVTSKTAAGIRKVPVHSALADIVRRRVGNKPAGAFLFHELPDVAPDKPTERSQPISKRFTRMRRRLGVDDVPEGHRQSRIDFHSLRRWFIFKAGQACLQGAQGFSQWTLAQCVGHEREEQPLPMTMGRYHGDDGVDALRACVEAVKLPV